MSKRELNAKDFYIRCLEQASSIVRHVEPTDLEKPTPDNKWSVADLLQHMLYELAWTPDIVRGKTIAEVGDVHDHIQIDANVPTAWHQALKDAKKAIFAANMQGPAHLSYTDTTVQDYLWEAGGDQLIHAWDLAEGIGYVIQFETDLAQAVYDRSKPNQPGMVDIGLFAPAVPVPENVDIQTKLLALSGRSLIWRS